MPGDGTVVKQTRFGDIGGYTPVTVKNKDTKETFVINFTNAKVKGNEAEWTIKDGKVYDKDGKTIEDNVMEVTRYQAALIKAAARGDDYKGEHNFLDREDLNGAIYADVAKEELQKAKSEYRLNDMETGYVPGDNGGFVPRIVPAADATEGGVIFAEVVNKDGETGGLTIDIRTPEQLADEQRRAEEAAEHFDRANKPWWKFW